MGVELGKHCGKDLGYVVLFNHFDLLRIRLFLAVSRHAIVVKKPTFYYFRQGDFVGTEFVYFHLTILANQVDC